MVKRILRYLKGTIDVTFHIKAESSLSIIAYSDADWAGCKETRRSTTGFCVFLGCNPVSWSTKKQPTVARSSTEAEYRAMATTAAEVTWLRFLLTDLGVLDSKTPVLFSDSMSALHLSVNPVFHARTKHIEIDYHYVREQVASKLLETNHISTTNQIADIFTKALPIASFQKFLNNLHLFQIST